MAGLRIRASSLIEVVVALMILVLISTLASAFIISNYKKTSTSYKIQAFLLLDNEVKKTLKEKDYESAKYDKDSFIIRKETTVQADKRLVTIYFSIEDAESNLIIERRRILMIDDTTENQFNGQNESIYYH